MADLFRQFFWMIFPICGMGIGAFAIWNEFSRQKKALDVLRIYAEKGTEPPGSVMAVLNRASSPRAGRSMRTPWSQAVFFLIMALGFGALTFWFSRTDPHVGMPFVMGFGMSAFAMAALGASALVAGFTARRTDGN